jgi:hypothetical protein
VTYLPASFFVVDVPGPGGWWIGLAQALAGDASRYKHAGLILDEQGTILEAEPQGARLANISEYHGDGLLISDGPVQRDVAEYVAESGSEVSDPKKLAVAYEKTVRLDVVMEAKKLVGTHYSWLDYAAIGALRLHLPSSALRRYVAASGHAQCAQLVDLAYMRAGVHLFDDGRQPGDVCPADLAAWAEDWTAAR